MAYKHIEIIGAYNVPGRGQVFVTLDRSIKCGDCIEVITKIWKVVSVELSDVMPHIGLVVVPYTEADAKQTTAKEAKQVLDNMFQPAEAEPAVVSPPEDKPKAPAKVSVNHDEQKARLIKVLGDLTEQMVNMREWTLKKLSDFELGEDPPSVLVLVVSMPRTSMQAYVEQLEKFLKDSINELETQGKLPWANVKAVAGCQQ